jgi:hypothetical protein
MMNKLSILQIRIATTFLLDPDIPVLLSKLAGRGYITARVKHALDAATIIPIEPPNVIAGKGTVRIDYDFGRKTLGIESPNPKEIITTSEEVWECLKEMNVDVQKALIPYEVIVVAEVSLKPRFTDNKYTFRELFDFNLRLMEGGFVSEDGDPTSNKWFHLKISPIWGSYKGSDKENLYRVTVVYREERSKLINFIENIENVLRKLLEGV